MKLTLMIEGDASAIARILATLPDGAGSGPVITNHVSMTPAPTIGGADDDDGPANASAPSVDSTGLPWDDRIHAKSKATNGDGTWRGRRGVDKATVAAVEAELRARAGATPAPVGQPAPVAMPVGTMPPMPMPIPTGQPAPMQQPMMPPVGQPVPFDPAAAGMPAMPAPVAMAQPAVAAAPVYNPPVAEPVAQPAPAATGTIDFSQFMQHLQTQMTKVDGQGMPLVHADYLAGLTAQISAAFNVPLASFTDISNQPNMVTYAVQLMQRDGRW